jgi:hypothetical protein
MTTFDLAVNEWTSAFTSIPRAAIWIICNSYLSQSLLVNSHANRLLLSSNFIFDIFGKSHLQFLFKGLPPMNAIKVTPAFNKS